MPNTCLSAGINGNVGPGGKTHVYLRGADRGSARVDGKPRQRYVAYLGGFTEHGIEHVHQALRSGTLNQQPAAPSDES
jgi:hypothetical protein